LAIRVREVVMSSYNVMFPTSAAGVGWF
jgi:hypothetical protein